LISKKLCIKIFILLIVFLTGISTKALAQKFPIGEPIYYNILDSIKVPSTLKIKSKGETITAKKIAQANQIQALHSIQKTELNKYTKIYIEEFHYLKKNKLKKSKLLRRNLL